MSKFTIEKMNILSSWGYVLKFNTECTICRCNLNSSSIYHEELGKESLLSNGVCGHTYHQECIKNWIKNNKHCPICSLDYIECL
jgi:RING-box protein 1